jgi:hypothetical protein
MADDSSPMRKALTRRNVLQLGATAVPTATLLAVNPARAGAAPVPASSTKEQTMQLTWKGHSCIRIEHDNFVTVIDPGVLSAPDAADGADALLISHRHLDHYDTSKIAAAAAARPGLAIYTNQEVAALLDQSGVAAGGTVHVIGHGDAFQAGRLLVHCYGEWHAPIYPDIPPCTQHRLPHRRPAVPSRGRVHRPGRPGRALAAAASRLLHQDQLVRRLRPAGQADSRRTDPRRHPERRRPARHRRRLQRRPANRPGHRHSLLPSC